MEITNHKKRLNKMMTKSGTAPAHEASRLESCGSVASLDSSPKTGNIQDSNESCGNTQPAKVGGNTRFYGFEGVYYPWFFARLVRSLGYPHETIVTGDGLKQDNFKHGLFVNVDYVDRRNGLTKLLVAVSTKRALEALALTVEEQMRRPLTSYQGVLS